MLNPHPKIEQEPLVDITLPQIAELADVYETGCLCIPKVIFDERNQFMPYVLNLFPIQKAILNAQDSSAAKVEPLMYVTIDQIPNEQIAEEDLKIED